ncbi:MAG: hypothetical protein R3E97_16220 [Candidatus Eisenbacteria bacterium]
MNCHELSRELIEGYVDLPPELKRQIDEHTRTCSRCRIEIQNTVATVRITERLGATGARREMIIRLHQRIIRVKRG